MTVKISPELVGTKAEVRPWPAAAAAAGLLQTYTAGHRTSVRAWRTPPGGRRPPPTTTSEATEDALPAINHPSETISREYFDSENGYLFAK